MTNALNGHLQKSKGYIVALEQDRRIWKFICREGPTENIGQTSRQLTTRITERRRKQRRTPLEKPILPECERNSSFALCVTADGHNIDYEHTVVFQLAFRTCTRCKFAETLAISNHFTRIQRIYRKDFVERWIAVASWKLKHSVGHPEG